MFKSRLFLGLVALAVSFCISLLTGRDFGKAVFTGLLTLFASLVGAAVSERRYRQFFNQRAEALRLHIHGLQRRRAEAYDDLIEITAERDRVAASLSSIPQQSPQHSTLWQPKLSWNLADPEAEVRAAPGLAQSLQTKIQQLEQQEAELNHALAATLTAKQRAELSLTTTQAELNQIQTQILEQKNLKEQLVQEIVKLTAQKQQLEADLSSLQPQLQELERYRSELNLFLASAEPKRQQVETGSKSLQVAIEQLQVQISSLHVELSQLEMQILERRTQKEELDQEIAVLQQAAQTTREHHKSSRERSQNSKVKIIDQSSARLHPSTPPLRSAAPPDEWTQFITELPAPEFQALRAIAEHANPNPAIKKIAEANLTMPELLIDAINERSLDTIGDLVIEPGSGSTAPTVAQEYLKTIQTLIIARAANR